MNSDIVALLVGPIATGIAIWNFGNNRGWGHWTQIAASVGGAAIWVAAFVLMVTLLSRRRGEKLEI